MVSWIEKIFHLKAVRFLCNLVLRKTLHLCGDVEKNPGPFNTSNLPTFDKVLDPSQKCLKFVLINARSIQNKYEDLSNLLEQLISQTILIVTETWISEQHDTNFNISNEHLFLQKARSKQMGVQRGGGVGVWIPRHFNVKRKNEFEIANANFFESMWLEIYEPLKDKCLVNVSYNPSKNLSDFFLNELSAEVSNAYSLTDNLLFGDYNIDQFNKNEKEILDDLTYARALNPTNVDTPTRISKTNQPLIDHCFMTKNQIVEWKVCLPPIEVDHNIIFYQSNLEMIGRNEDTYFFRRNMKFFSGEKFNRDLAFADWRPMDREENCDEMFTKLNEVFQSILDQLHLYRSVILQ